MRRALIFLLFFATSPAWGTPPELTVHAVVKLWTHGASETVIFTEGPSSAHPHGRTILLGCGHAFGMNPKDRNKPMSFDAPTPPGWPAPVVKPIHRLVFLDYIDGTEHDLSLIEVDCGPLPYVMRVAPAGHHPSNRILAVGYDEMAKVSVKAPTTIISEGQGLFWTRERPVPGRSGGALCDVQFGYLIGVCQGYETSGQRRGMYVSHATVLTFLTKRNVQWLFGGSAPAVPQSPGPRLPIGQVQPAPCPPGGS